ncbi:unnamed protein product [Victoria cruziana]
MTGQKGEETLRWESERKPPYIVRRSFPPLRPLFRAQAALYHIHAKEALSSIFSTSVSGGRLVHQSSEKRAKGPIFTCGSTLAFSSFPEFCLSVLGDDSCSCFNFFEANCSTCPISVSVTPL